MSDWATISLACGHTRRGTCYKLIPFVIWFLRRFNLSKYWKSMISDTKFGKSLARLNLFGYWQNEMGQSSIFGETTSEFNRIALESIGRTRALVWLDDLFCQALFLVPLVMAEYISVPLIRFLSSWKTSIRVPQLVKREIISCLQKTSIGISLTNGEAALRDNVPVSAELLSTLKNQSQTMTMLIWHTATEYCNLPPSCEMEEHQNGSQDEEKVQIENYKQVAIALSRYCVYLIAFIPALLPGDSTDTLLIYRGVVNEVVRRISFYKPCKAQLLEVITHSESCRGNEEGDINAEGSTNNNNEDTIFMKGLKLGKKLDEIEDSVLRWKVMAEFWAETIIYIAPSDNATAHMERLAQGGEFLTHVWALLSHAGILQRDQKLNPQDTV
ncbi:unnamed protein product [Urochloa humidicola]